MEHVKCGGAIPKSRALTPYLKDCYTADKKRLKEKLFEKQIILFFDETYDSKGRFVSCVLAAIVPPIGLSLQPLLLETFFEREPLDHAKVGQQIISTLSLYKVTYENVVGYGTDNASYMLASYVNPLSTLLPNCIHLTCVSHILNIVVKDFMSQFSLAVSWSTKFASYFSKSGARKYRFENFLKAVGLPVKLAPRPVPTRWTSTFDAILYHCQCFSAEQAFLELEKMDSDETEILEFMHENFKQILAEILIIKLRVHPLIRGLKVFESNLGFTCLMHEFIESIGNELAVYCDFVEDSLDEVFGLITETFSSAEKSQLLKKLSSASTLAKKKFDKYFHPETGNFKYFLPEIQTCFVTNFHLYICCVNINTR